jgi:hypothetical protein
MSRDGVEVSGDAKRFLLKFTVALAVLPLGTLFLVRDVLAPQVGLQQNVTDALAIVFSVIVVQLILVWSCAQAFAPERDEDHEKTN